MRLAGFGLYRYELPLSQPLTLGGRVLHRREGILLELVGEGGAAGWGEASPLPAFSRESPGEAVRQLRYLASSLVDRKVALDGARPEGDPVYRRCAPSVRFGFELALRSLCAATRRKTLAGLLAPRPRATVALSALIPRSLEGALEEARRLRSAGYEAVKLKVGGRAVDEDLELVHALEEELGDAVALRLDANRAWGLEEAERFVRGAAGSRFEYLEEPLADPAQLPLFARRCGVPVALDETLARMEPEALEDHAYARAVVLKPTLLGGISRTLRFASSASRLGMETVVSSAYETGVGTAALLALAAGAGAAGGVPAGLDTYRYLARDVLRPPLDLPAPRVDVRELAAVPREVDRRLLRPVG